jgi:membrane protein
MSKPNRPLTVLGIFRDILVEVNKWRAMNLRHRQAREAHSPKAVRVVTPQEPPSQPAEQTQKQPVPNPPPGSPLQPRNLLYLLRNTIEQWNSDKAPQLAAALAYYTVFSMAPLLIIVIAIAGLIFGQSGAENQIVGQIRGTVGEESALLIQDMLKSASRPADGMLATIIGLVTLLAGAAGVFGQLKAALNTMWNVPPAQGPGGLAGILNLLKQEFLSFTMVLGIGFLLLVSLVLSATIAALSNFVNNNVTVAPVIWEIINFVVSFGIITLLFAAIYKVLPDARIDWQDVWIGAALTSLLFTIGKLLLGLYLGRSSVASSYGAAGSLVVILLWVYYSAQIAFFGAEFTQVYANRFGSRISYRAASKAQTAQRAKAASPSRG